MDRATVLALYRESLEAIENQYGLDLRAASLAAAGAWWMAVVALDEGRPPNWLRSAERTAAVTDLEFVRDHFTQRISDQLHEGKERVAAAVRSLAKSIDEA